jgi:hypothetical protein
MNCEDYLAMLATLPVHELNYGRAQEHVAHCADCSRVTRVVAERERNIMHSYGDLQSRVPAAQTAHSALRASRHRKVKIFYRLGMVGALVVAFVVIASARTVRSGSTVAVNREIFHLQCLSPDQAAAMLRPHMTATGRITARQGSPLGVLTVEGSREEVLRARTLIEEYDNAGKSQCTVQVRVPIVR